MTDTMPATPADTAGSAGPEGAAAAATAAGISPTPVTAGTTTGSTVFSGLTAPSGSMSPNTPKGFDTKTVSTQYTSADIGRLSDLIKLVSGIATSHPLDGFNAEVITDVGKNAGLSPQQIAALKSGNADAATKQKASDAAWKGALAQLANLGVSSNYLESQGITTPPSASNGVSKAAELVKVPLESTTLQQLQNQGVDVTGLKDVNALVHGHDQGRVTLPGTAAPTTLGAEYDQFVNDWNNGTAASRTSTVQNLTAVGALDTTAGAPTLQQVAQAQQNIMLYASDNNLTVPAAYAELEKTTPKGNVPGQTINTENIDQSMVMHLASQWGITISPYQATTLANVAAKAGTGTDPIQDIILPGLVSLYDPANPSTDGGNLSGMVYQAVNDNLAQWGVPSTPELAGKLTQQVLQGGAVTSPYTATTLAATDAETYAKQQVGSLYGEGVQQAAAAGTSVAQQAQPYLSTASALLGTPTSEMEVNDPSGIWMAWSHGGTGPGGVQTQQEWSKTLQTDPQYKYQEGQTAATQEGGAATGLLQLFGKLPSTAPNLPGPTVSPGSTQT